MSTVWEKICNNVGICAKGEIAERSIIELLPCIGRNRSYAVKKPFSTAYEITEYLDDIVRNP